MHLNVIEFQLAKFLIFRLKSSRPQLWQLQVGCVFVVLLYFAFFPREILKRPDDIIGQNIIDNVLVSKLKPHIQ